MLPIVKNYTFFPRKQRQSRAVSIYTAAVGNLATLQINPLPRIVLHQNSFTQGVADIRKDI